MSRTLYICVDESGTEASGDYFTTASCWFVSEKPPRAALNETKVSLIDQLSDLQHIPGDVPELKGKDLDSDAAAHLFQNFIPTVHRNNTVENTDLPWDGRPVQYNIHGVDAATGREALANVDQRISIQTALRTTFLLSSLNPLLYNSPLNTKKFDDVQVLLDGEIWVPSMEAVQDTQRVNEIDSISFSIHDSQKIPGIQFADVAANYRWSRRNGRQHQIADEKLAGLEFDFP